MVAAKVGFDILGKFFPKAVATLGKAGLVEASVAAGGIAAVTTEVCDKVVVPAAQKGAKKLKAIYDAKTAGKKQELMEKRAALLEKKAQKIKAEAEASKVIDVEPEEVKVEVVEDKPKKGSNKKNK